ncbi:hypothetical protein V2J09_022044 [Rumex salicifolius]
MESENQQIPSSQTQLNLISKYTKRVVLRTVLGRNDAGLGLVGQKIVVGGWVKSAKEIGRGPIPPPLPAPAPAELARAPVRKAGLTCSEILQIPLPFVRSLLKVFGVSRAHAGRGKNEDTAVARPPIPTTVIVEVSDGSSVPSLQVVVDSSLAPPGHIMLNGTCILVEGIVQKASSGLGKHLIEIKAENVLHLGVVDHDRYPLSKKRVPLDTLRNWAHFRPRTTTVASITRISNTLTHATHAFFQDNSFLHVQVPIITTTDSEGFSNKFHVTTLLHKQTDPKEVSNNEIEAIKASIKEKNKLVDELRRTDSNREALDAAIQDLKKTNELAAHLEAKDKARKARKKSGSSAYARASFEEDFFACQAYLTVSGRLHLGSYACALGNVYSFGPRFKADPSHSPKQAAEVWKVEAEIAFAELEEAMECAIDYLKFLCKWILDNCSEDMKFVLKRIDKSAIERLQSLTSAEYEKISYAQAVGKKFAVEVEWGIPLTEEHESFLADEIYKKPVIVYNHPKEIKPFYVRLNDDGQTVATFDILAPKVGALIGGSQNEERLNMLSSRIKEMGLQSEQYEWYLDLCCHGTVKHSGFSLGFDIMVLLATGITSVDNVIPFPRSHGRVAH